MSTLMEPTTTAVITKTKTDTGFSEVSTWNELVEVIDAREGVVMIPMETLRRLEGAQRLGIHVLKSISSRLATLGVGHMPEDLPNRQDQEAILYRYGTPASEVISAVRNGLTGSISLRSVFDALHRVNAAPEITEVVHREVLDDKLTTAAKAVLELLGPSGRTGLVSDMLEDM